MKRLLPFLALPLLLALAAIIVSPVGFTQSPSINDGATTYVTDSLICRWNTTDTTAENINWYRNGVFYTTTYDNTTLITNNTLPPGTALKNEAWLCVVTLSNATANTTQQANVTIQNSAPTTPIVTNTSGHDIGTAANITEHQTSTYTLNSTDADPGDVLTYYLKQAAFCTVTNSATGTVSCTPGHADVSLPNQSEVVTQKNITFWVDDNDPIFAKSASITVTFTITPVNDPPTLTIPLQTTPVNATFNQTFLATDEELNYPLVATLIPSLTDPAIATDVHVTEEGNSTVRITYFTSPIDWSDVGNRTVTLNLTDSFGASNLVNFTLQITAVNRPPYFTNIIPVNRFSPLPYTYVLSQGQNVTINLSANDPDTADHTQILIFGSNTTMSQFFVTTTNSTATNTSDATGFVNFTATNDDVGNHSVNVTVTDQLGAVNWTTLNFTIINVNDPPVIYNQSFNPNNTGYNLNTTAGINITPLVAYLNAPFRYQINVTDPDLILRPPWDCEFLSWTTNTTMFNITSGMTCGEAGGLINFTPTGTSGNQTINITVTDNGGLSDNRIILFEIKNNTPPRFNATFPTLVCGDDVPCVLNLARYATDDDPGDYVANYAATFVGATLGSFTLNATTGLITFIPQMAEIGNYTAWITITDTRGATAWQLLNITVHNTPHPPAWKTYDFSGQTIVQDHPFNFLLAASDKDLLLPGSTENLSFTVNTSWATLTLMTIINDTYYVLLSFTPNITQVGSQSFRLNVTDTTNLTNSTVVNFTVLAKSTPPSIIAVQPYADPLNGSLIRGWLPVSGGLTTQNISLAENTTDVLFSLNVVDALTPPNQLVYTWYYDGAIVQPAEAGASSVTRTFDFWSSGNHTLFAVVNNTRLESTNWTWNLMIADVPRPPYMPENFSGTKQNITVSATTTKENYFVYSVGVGGFYSPDDDPANNPAAFITSNNTLHLTYAVTGCAVANFSFTNNSFTIQPVSVGSCTVQFNATTPAGLSAESNLVTINVSQVPQGAQQTTVSSGGGGGGSMTQTTLVPLKENVESPKPLSILAPKLITIYENQTVDVPIEVRNNWTTSLKSIVLTAKTNATDVRMSFDNNFIEELPVNATRKVTMTVYGYRLGENFEVELGANVTSPVFHDTALVLFNSIEQSQEGKDVSLKVTFAQDLLSQHDECKELNELLQQADAQMRANHPDEANRLAETVINGCQYLISKTQQDTQRPGIIRTPFFELSDAALTIISYVLLGIAIIGAAAGLLYYHYKTKEEYNF